MPAAVQAVACRGQWLTVILVAMAALGPLSLNLFKPCLPWIRADLSAPLAVVQLGLSLSILAAAVATVVSGCLGHRCSGHFHLRHILCRRRQRKPAHTNEQKRHKRKAW